MTNHEETQSRGIYIIGAHMDFSSDDLAVLREALKDHGPLTVVVGGEDLHLPKSAELTATFPIERMSEIVSFASLAGEYIRPREAQWKREKKGRFGR